MFAMAEVGAELAHEINQPLTALMLYLQAARRLGSSPADNNLPMSAMAILEKAVSEAERVADIVHQIEQLAARNHPVCRNVDIRRLVEEAVELTCPADLPKTSVSRHYEAQATHILVDPLQIQQILIDLLDDAFAAAGTGKVPIIGVSTRSGNGSVTICIEDNRSRARCEKKLLTDAVPSTSRNSDDFALAISMRIVRSHGGNLSFDAHQGRYRATMRLPVSCVA